ncbi:MAG TPA: leucine-rich repeat domain-containing protein [Candidatus Lokiarchaeia archaeon]|nr:leucine-rich repeat domain-containing protein [Candidatus Lokiarchaeia archaeon]
MDIPKLQFTINTHLKLKLFGGKTFIYVDNKRFNQCKYLLLARIDPCAIKTPASMDPGEHTIDSIDEAAVMLDHSMEPLEGNPEVSIDAMDEFWGHCSNLQAWAEHDYDTRLLHSNLSFPLLKALADVGDPVASGVFKAEIVSRFKARFEPTRQYLVIEDYMKYLDPDDRAMLARHLSRTGDLGSILVPVLCNQGYLDQFGMDDIDSIRTLHSYVTVNGKSIFAVNGDLHLDAMKIRDLNDIDWSGVTPSRITGLFLRDNWLNSLPAWIKRLVNLTVLDLSNNFLNPFPDPVLSLLNLEKLNINFNMLVKIPETISRLTKLLVLQICQCGLHALPESLGNLQHLRSFAAAFNLLQNIPSSFSSLQSLIDLDLRDNLFLEFPPPLLGLKKLETLEFGKSWITKLPRSFDNMQSLELLRLNIRGFNTLPRCLKKLVLRARVIVNGKSAKNGFIPVPLPEPVIRYFYMCDIVE